MKKSASLLLCIALAGAAVLSGCGKKDDTLRIFAWEGYIPQQIIEKFTEETGIKVAVENYASRGEMMEKLRDGRGHYDLVQPSDQAVGALVKDNMLLPLNPANIPNLKNIAPEFREMPFDPGNKYSVPWMAGFVGIVYNAETVTGPVVGYRDVFTPEHAGRIVLVDDPREIVAWGLAAAGLPINDVTDENIVRITPMLADWLAKVGIYDSVSPKNALSGGDADIGILWSGEAALLFRENPKFQWVLPAEGFHMFVDNIAIPKTARHREYAEKFINFILRPDIGRMISQRFPYYNPNAGARKLLTPEELNNPASYPPGLDIRKAGIFSDIGDQESKMNEVVSPLKVQ